MKKWKEKSVDGLVSLDYIRFLNVPMKQSKQGPIIDLAPDVLDQLAAKAIIKQRIPLRGKEVKFLRKILGLSLEKFANKMSLSSGTVFHWEKEETERLAPVNEVCVRVLLAEELNIDLQAKFSQLLGQSHDRIEVKAS